MATYSVGNVGSWSFDVNGFEVVDAVQVTVVSAVCHVTIGVNLHIFERTEAAAVTRLKPLAEEELYFY